MNNLGLQIKLIFNKSVLSAQLIETNFVQLTKPKLLILLQNSECNLR